MKHKDFDYKDLLRRVQVPPAKNGQAKPVSLKRFDPAYVPRELSKEESEQLLAQGIAQLAEYQDKLYAQDTYSLLIIFQALDAAGKDGTIKHVMSGVNPQGCEVHSFRAPNPEELDHDYLWRAHVRMPSRGKIGIFNRSYYEEALVVRVHPQFLAGQRLPSLKNVWEKRFRQINEFERHLTENGTRILKFYLNVSKEEQKKRFLERIAEPEKNWKFRAADVDERVHWKDYRQAYEDVFRHTSTKHAPWYVIPADNKWFTRVAVASIIHHTLREINPRYPKLSAEDVAGLDAAKKKLEAEGREEKPATELE